MSNTPRSALSLLVSRVRTDHADHALAADELALVAHPPDARSYLHGGSGLAPLRVGRIYCMGRVKGGKTLYADTQRGVEVLSTQYAVLGAEICVPGTEY